MVPRQVRLVWGLVMQRTHSCTTPHTAVQLHTQLAQLTQLYSSTLRDVPVFAHPSENLLTYYRLASLISFVLSPPRAIRDCFPVMQGWRRHLHGAVRPAVVRRAGAG